MIRVVVAVALFVALPPATPTVPQHDPAAIGAGQASHLERGLPVANGLETALSARLTWLAPPRSAAAPALLLRAAPGTRRQAWSARLLL
jgi:hypothetical protein